ncbi:MAG: hypothetical protein EAZ78_28315 [Oscillatoriales cyanobacterium]|nr:MAG: hypothetical protein EAZ88_22720 [Oscillatoriales cyanobacterium]TAE66117.1 MAG: hypothetical protein EAZ86_21865 [Oscillatoriales cyanobacterium]TAE94526.1 MAG: hypothetical protein EAZ78_28315 [Oscillatoriales cyanobacterium]TAG01236.1 MAG: hypothetical protein EAZ45_13730 [Oscillatoriales cyanobacterium]TAG21608.1 MAG: hypothetical protein EAZ39_04375 [Oscillatoriales cyanobacterium]
MILNSLESNTTHKSKAAGDEFMSILTKKLEAKELEKRAKNLQRNSLGLGKTYLRILESGGYLGC